MTDPSTHQGNADKITLYSKAEENLLQGRDAAASWFIATLLALNGAGLLAVSAFPTSSRLTFFAAVCFVIGVILLLLQSIIAQYTASVALEYLRRARAYMMGATLVGDRGRLNGPPTLDKLDSIRWMEPVDAIARVSSVLCFILGVIGLALLKPGEDQANVRRCEAIQADMLAARPRRVDDVALFQALGCRPQGKGNVYALPRTSSSSKSQ